MIFAASIGQRLADGRVSANLLTFYGLIVLVILAGLIVRALLARGRSRLTALKGFRWIQNIGQEAVPRLRFLVTLLSLATPARRKTRRGSGAGRSRLSLGRPGYPSRYQ